MPTLTKSLLSTSVVLLALAAPCVQARMVVYELQNVVLEEGSVITGQFTWLYTPGSFDQGVGRFTALDIPYTVHDHTDLDVNIDVTESIEITLGSSTHDDGVDISFVLLQPLTPTTPAAFDLSRSKYEIGGNGFHDGVFLSGSVAPAVPEPATYALWGLGLAGLGAVRRRRGR
jgi:hypothetical protein